MKKLRNKEVRKAENYSCLDDFNIATKILIDSSHNPRNLRAISAAVFVVATRSLSQYFVSRASL